MLALPSTSQTQHEKAAVDAIYYTLDQLQQFHQLSSLGFKCAALAGWILMSFFIGQFFAGDEFENYHQWRAIQVVYVGMGIMLATAIIMAQIVLFNSGKTREYLIMAGFTIGFCVFAETAATMQREQLSVSYKSVQSGVYQATLKAANRLAQNTDLTPTQVQLGYAQADLEQAQRNQNDVAVQLAQTRINRLQKQVDLEQTNRSALLTTTLQQAKVLEYDETKHQAMIRFLAQTLGWSHVQGSAALALFLILTFELCFHYLGGTTQRASRALAIKQGEVSVQLDYSALPIYFHSLLPISTSNENNQISQSIGSDSTAYMQLDDELYQLFITDLKARRVGITYRDMQDWIKVNIKEKAALYDLAQVTSELLAKAEQEGYLKANPEYRQGNRKPKYLLD